ncbi:hybrid sensor histidine kinase/response regulator [Chelativorans salis]|uniref:histidine kinase n=1 Tax=Chelativorans salis TaxID=2978478 RepID=A0ABT2LII4_9HYPH|nr:response regulator [Chelativorans sp. EGI FJ00035]MCT7374366.1 response regulator [Chelativorans sp. EGI FJ00035]
MKATGLDRQLLELFVQEVKERSSEIENNLLTIEKAEAPEKHKLQERLLRIIHSLKGAAGLVEVRPVEAVCHRMEDLLSSAAHESRTLARAELDLLLAATDAIADAARALDRGEPLAEASFQDVLRRLEAGKARKVEPPAAAVKGHPPLPPIRASDLDGSVRMSADQLDTLLYQSGDLVASRSRIRLRAEQALMLKDQARRLRSMKQINVEEAANIETGLRALAAGLTEDANLFRGSVAALDHEVRRARMQLFSETCQGLPRMVRDMVLASGKAAELRISGGEIEIDRSILAGLQDSLRHLVRNAIGHGIETPEERRAAGKPAIGRITVSAVLVGESLQVRVEDDGRGFDIESIRKAAGMAGLPEPQDERQGLRQAFEPGVSTSAQVTELSGRGIGLDIVKNAVERMRGTVDVSHAPGGGAAFVLTLPLTLATLHALEVTAGGQVFAVDTASIRRVLRVSAKDLPAAGEPNILPVDGQSMCVIDLAGWLGLPSRSYAGTDILPVVVIGPAGGEVAVLVDGVAGEQELLARSLGARLSNIGFYSGGTVLPDGRVALLLNAAALAEAAATETAASIATVLRTPTPPRRKVLVVDDSPAIRTLEKLILEAAGYDVVMAADGTEAWDYLQTHDVDIVVADVDMPAMDGFRLTQTIRESASFKDLPVILVTGRETPEDVARGLDMGANAYVAKAGFDQQQFIETIRQVV